MKKTTQGSQKFKSSCFFDKVAKIPIYLLAFILPIFFLPFTFNALDFNKQQLLILLVFISFIGWLIKSLIDRKINFNISLLNIPVIILFFVTIFSVLFSLSKSGSFWGWPLSIPDSFTSLFSFVIIYLLIANLFTEHGDIFKLCVLLIFSAFLATIFGGLQIFGKFILPWEFTKTRAFNTVGTVNSLGTFLAVILVLTTSLILQSKKLRFFLIVCSLIFLSALILINFKIAWIVLAVGCLFVFISGIIRAKKIQDANLLLFPMTLIILGIFFIIFSKLPFQMLPSTPLEVSPSQKTTFEIMKSVLRGKDLILGTGPGTFIYDYSKFKPTTINQTVFWNVRFGSGSSEVFDKVINTGILGFLSFIFLILISFWQSFSHFKKYILEKDIPNWFLETGIFASLFAVILLYFLYPTNITISFIFWIFLGITAALEKEKIKSLKIQSGSPLFLEISFVLVLFSILGIGFLLLSGQRYLAEMRYLDSLIFIQKGDLDKSIESLLSAVNLNSGNDTYWRELSQNYLIKLNQEIQKENVPREEMAKSIQNLVTNAVNAAKQASDMEPANGENWGNQGSVYRNLIGFLPNSNDLGVESYKKAIELEPNNPLFYTELGRVYLAQAGILTQQTGKEAEREEVLKNAEENFEIAIRYKSDYVPAHFQLAILYQTRGELKKAISKLEEAKLISPSDIGVAFQLGVFYYNDSQFDKAQLELERAINLSLSINGEDYANARYFLGLAYDKLGQKEKAIEQFEKIKLDNPNNEQINNILDNLKAGKPALGDIVPNEPTSRR